MDEFNITELETNVKLKFEESEKLEKELKQITNKNKNLKNEIDKKSKEIIDLQKELGALKMPKEEKKMKNIGQESTKITLEEQITKNFKEIQEKINSNLQKKYKFQNIQYLINQQRNLNLSYLIIKKLDIREEFYNKFNIEESPNLYENLNELSKQNKLNYAALKSCGPYLIFKLTLESKFNEIKEKCCEYWNIPNSTYNLYDDTFCNIECILNYDIQRYFSFYQPSDITLPEGHVCFYLIEKLKQQKGLLNVQKKALNKNESNGNDNKNNTTYINDLDKCVDCIKSGEILKGINNYHYDNIDPNQNFIKLLKQPENNIICFFICLVLWILSLIMIEYRFGNMNNYFQSKIISVYININHSNFMDNNYNYGMFDHFKNIVNFSDQLDKEAILEFYGPKTIRFFITEEKECKTKENTYGTDENFFKITNLKCYYQEYNDDKHKNKNDWLGIKYSDDTDIKHIVNSFNGKFDKTGHMIRFTDFSEVMNLISNETFKEDLNYNRGIIGYEYLFTLYDLNSDLFIANVIFVLRSNINYALPYKIDSIAFLPNIYENHDFHLVLDIVRIFLFIILYLTTFISIFRIIKDRNLKIFGKIYLSIKTIIDFKNLILLFSLCFFCSAVRMYRLHNIDTKDYYNNPSKYIDFYHYAVLFRRAKNFEVLSFYLISFYLLKYLQLFNVINKIFTSIRKSLFEILILLIILFLLIIGFICANHFIFGSYIIHFNNFLDSIIYSLELIIYIENTNIIENMRSIYSEFTIGYFLIYIIFIRFFFLLLFYPIIIDYLRMEIEQEKYLSSVKPFTFSQKFKLFLKSFFTLNGKNELSTNEEIKKTEDDQMIKETEKILDDALGKND